MEAKLLLKVTEAAALLSVGRSKVYELIQSGDLRSVRIDGARRVRVDDLRDYVQRLSGAA